MAVICVSESTVYELAGPPPKKTLAASVKLAPVMVTFSAPSALALLDLEGEAAFDAGADFGDSLFEAATDELVGGCGLHLRVGRGAAEIG